MNYRFGSTGLADGSYTTMSMASSNAMTGPMMSVSTAAPMLWTTQAWPDAKVEVREPKPLERVCKWCGAMFHSSEFYPGNCICCGGPRGI